MRSLKDDEGASLKIRPTILVVPPALEDDANYLMTADRFLTIRQTHTRGRLKFWLSQS
jgi:phage major head subunit gpT-like protein